MIFNIACYYSTLHETDIYQKNATIYGTKRIRLEDTSGKHI